MRVRTTDLDSTEGERRRFYTVESLGEKRHLTPEGFLVCEDVPLARTGEQIYGAFDGVPIPPGPDGRIYVLRTEAEVFRAATMASANGKDVVDEHPQDDVTPDNWRGLTCGTVLAPRRGRAEDNQQDLMIGDLIVKDKGTIAAILAGKREISLGYDADYVKLGVGKGEQRNIIINHVALVDRGRCGPRCAIGDRISIPTPAPAKTTDCGCHSKETSMTTKTLKARVLDALKKMGGIKDDDMEKTADAVVLAVGTNDEESPNIHVHMTGAGGTDGNFCTRDDFEAHVKKNDEEHSTMRDSIENMRKEMEAAKQPTADEVAAKAEEKELEEVKDEMSEEVPEDKKEEAGKARDSAYLEDSFNQTLADAEILVPGINPPMTFDKAAKPVKTFKDGICGLRRTALDAFYLTSDGRAYIDQSMGGRTVNFRDSAAFPCKRVTDMFRGAVAMKRTLNNSKAGGGNGNQARTGDQHRPAFGSTPVITADQLANQAAKAWGNGK